jgi:glycine/D-amino acid oxidase-like deaminating enzyme
MLLSDPTTKKAASAKAETWRQEILDICPTLSDEGAMAAWSGSRPVPPVAPKTRIFQTV